MPKNKDCGSIQRLLNVRNDVIGILDAHGEADEVRTYACFNELLIRELAVCMAGGMEHAGAGIGHVGDDSRQLQVVHKADGHVASALQTEGDDTARTVGHILLRQFIIFVAGQAAIVHPCHFVALLEVFGHLLCVTAMLGHTQVQGLQAEVQQEGVHRALDAAQVAHQLGCGFGDVGHLAESLRVGQAVVGLIGRTQAGELVGMGIPVEVAAVHNAAAYAGGVSVHVFSGRMHHDVGSPFEGAAVDGRGEGIVHDEGHAMRVGDAGKLLNVQHFERGVGDGFAKQSLGIGTEGFADFLFRIVGVDEGHVDAQLLHGHAKEVERAAVDGRRAYEMVARLADVEHGIEVGGLSAGSQHGAYATFQCGNLGGHGVVRGILEAGVEVTAVFQVEEAGHLLARVIFESGALIDREHARLALLGRPSGLYADGFRIQLFGHNSMFVIN